MAPRTDVMIDASHEMSKKQNHKYNDLGKNLLHEDIMVDLSKSEDVLQFLNPSNSKRRRKRDIIRQVSVRFLLQAHDFASSAVKGIFRQRIQQAEALNNEGNTRIDINVAPSRKAIREPWNTIVQDDMGAIRQTGKTYEDLVDRSHSNTWSEFFLSRVTDPTSFFFKYHFDKTESISPVRAQIHIVSIAWLKPHEEVVSLERVDGLKKAILIWQAYLEPLLVDKKTGAILDGHHRYNVGIQLKLSRLPVVLVDYMNDESIKVDVWDGCGRSTLTKEEVIQMSLSKSLFPPKTSRHTFCHGIPPISIPLSDLRESCGIDYSYAIPLAISLNSSNAYIKKSSEKLPEKNENEPLVRHASIRIISEAKTLAFSALRGIFRNRLRFIEELFRLSRSHLDVVERRTMDQDSFFNAVRVKDPTSSFCQQSWNTFEDLLSRDVSEKKKFYSTRVADPTSYFYKYHFEKTRCPQPKRLKVDLVDITWLKCHEHVVSWERVEGLKRATIKWDAYVEPLLVDKVSGAILDGHHRYHVGKLLGLGRLPAVLVDYLMDDSITVDTWPKSGFDSITKEMVIDMALSHDLFPPKTSRHAFSDDLPPISVQLDTLRKLMD